MRPFSRWRGGSFSLVFERGSQVDLLRREVPASSLVIAIDPGKAMNRVWLTTGERGLIGEPVSLPVLRDGIDELERLIVESGVAGPPVIGLEATGRCIGHGRRRSSGAGRGRCGCSRRQRRRPLARSSGRGGSRPTIVIARRWSGCCAKARAAGRAGRGRGAAGDGPPSPPARRRAQEAPAAPARPAQRALPRPVRAGLARTGADHRVADRAGHPGQRRGVRRAAAERAVVAGPRPGPNDQATAAFWIAALEAAAARRRQTPSYAPPGWGATCSLAGLQADIAACEAELEVLLAQTAGPGPDQPARRRSRSRRRVQRVHPADRALAHARSICTQRPGWRRPPISPRRSPGAARSPRTGLAEHRDALMGIAWGLSLSEPRRSSPATQS